MPPTPWSSKSIRAGAWSTCTPSWPPASTPTATAEVRLSVRAIVKVVAAVIVAAPLLEAMHRVGLPIADRLHVLLIVGAVISALAFVLIAAFGLLLDRPLRT